MNTKHVPDLEWTQKVCEEMDEREAEAALLEIRR
jgi:hypothetical protein